MQISSTSYDKEDTHQVKSSRITTRSKNIKNTTLNKSNSKHFPKEKEKLYEDLRKYKESTN